MVAVGTETDGSIACPASMNGIVGLKPTVGLVSRTGIIPISKSQDTAGPMGRTVKDVAILLGAMTGEDPLDVATMDSHGKAKTDYTKFLKPGGLKGKRIGVEKSMVRDTVSMGALLKKALDQMKKQGATIVEVEFLDQYNGLEEAEFEMMKYEFKDGLNKYLRTTRGQIKSLANVIQFDLQHESTVMPTFKQEILDSAQAKGGLNSIEYKRVIEQLSSMHQWLDSILEDNKLDILCGVGYGAYGPAAVAGYPSITVPMGLSDDLPVGITFFGRPFDEAGLLEVAYAYEQVSKNRVSPQFLVTLNRN
jgi:amidase